MNSRNILSELVSFGQNILNRQTTPAPQPTNETQTAEVAQPNLFKDLDAFIKKIFVA